MVYIERFQANSYEELNTVLEGLVRGDRIFNGGVFILFAIPRRFYCKFALSTVNTTIDDINRMGKNHLPELVIAYIHCSVGVWKEVWAVPNSPYKIDKTLGLRQLPTLIEYSLTDRRRIEGRMVYLDEQFLSVDYITRFFLKQPLNVFQ
ncbi:hypothetical protein niasHS_002720 [Heterodera schachtii]|uniref:Uncharacterized protein n=2 Tax=Heterodera TaxID=34509 RepID=A0ABD2K2A2_HETSC